MTGIDAFDAAVAVQPSLAERWIFMSGDVLNPDLHAFAEARGIPLLAKPFDLVDGHPLGAARSSTDSAWRSEASALAARSRAASAHGAGRVAQRG